MESFRVRPLPSDVESLLQRLDAPPRLVAHLELVHDVAHLLVKAIDEQLPELEFDRDAVLIGAAIHDIGKALCRSELTGSGNEHEVRGRELLLESGFPENHARFALTHGGPTREPNPTIEDLLVRAADAIWKGGRYKNSEDEFVQVISTATGRARWEVFTIVDDILTEIAASADARLEYQNSFPA